MVYDKYLTSIELIAILDLSNTNTMQAKDLLTHLKARGTATTRSIAEAFGISRAYAHYLLQQLREEGLVLLIGNTNQAQYVLASNGEAVRVARQRLLHIFFRLRNKGLDEGVVLQRLKQQTGILLGVAENVDSIVGHGFTEMLNNAIDHSKSSRIEVDCRKTETAITFVVRDFGVGIFNNVRNKLRLPGTLSAIQEILKGKATTAPQNHSGEGVFFTSKMADVFVIDSFDKRLVVNNLLPDIFITDRKALKGTRVSFSIHLTSRRAINDVFLQFTGTNGGDSKFDKTRITVKLFQFGHDLPSRSEAKRVTLNLENFQRVELDFSGVKTIGQSFADEVFRVWQTRHPETRIEATHTNDNVAFMIKRAGGSLGQRSLPI